MAYGNDQGVFADVKRLTGKVQGLVQVDTAQSLYLCSAPLAQWVASNKKYFMEGVDERLVPRGILLDGDPGVGKSEGAKYIANEFGVPLYRLDLGGAMGMYVGQSEQGLARILAALDDIEPCLILADGQKKIPAEK